MEVKVKREYNMEYLLQLLNRDKAIILGEYNKLNSQINITFQCKCGQETTKLFSYIAHYAGAFCETCTKNNKEIKKKITCKSIYGVENPSQSEEIKKKKEETYIDHFGMHPKKTKEVQDKYEATCIKRYGFPNSAQAEEVKEKIQKTFDEKYDGHPMFKQEVKDKVKETCLEIYGGHPMHNQEVKDKVKETCLEIYGGHPMQVPEIMEKTAKKSKSYKKYTMPSGDVRNVQGYEPFALNILLKEYNEEQIITDRKNIPKIDYTYNDINKVYFPDIYIPSSNLIIEVKSEWIYNIDKEINIAKEIATKEFGYNYEVWKFNRKGERI
jgi:hypothetical protein